MRRPPSLRNRFLLLGTGLSGLVLLLIAALVISLVWLVLLTTYLRQALSADHAVVEIQFNLFRAARSHELFGETGDPSWQEDARVSGARLDHWLDVVRRLPKSPEATESFARLDSTIGALRRDVLSVHPTKRTARLSDFQEANAVATEFLSVIESEADTTIVNAGRWSRIAIVLAAISVLFALINVVFVSLFARRVIYLPIVRLRRALEAHATDPTKRIPEGGSREIQAIGADVNEMLDRLAAQREQQLTFLAGVAHDLRNPMTALRTAAQLAERRAETEAQRKQVKRLLRQVDRMNRLVDDLLDVSRIEAGRFEIQLEPGDLREVVRDTCALYTDVSEIHEIRCALPDDPVRACFDSTRISQVLGNLVGNAIKYSPAGGPVDVRLSALDRWAILEVSDQGLGIPPQEQATIFEPFRRSSGPAEGIPGVGLGLSVARRLVQAHHGAIELQSAPGEGSTFRVRLPLVEPPAREPIGGGRED